jgi:DNA-binding CsgD family transcriptional regulator/tetratricopeptide (TPR) repeat protein
MEFVQHGSVVGRSVERSALEVALAAGRSGTGACVVLMGEAGIGKSRLCRMAQEHASSSDMVVFSGRVVEGRPAEPLLPLAEALAAAFRETGPPNHPSLLPFQSTLAHLVPAWSRKAAPPVSVIAVGEALLRLLRVSGSEGGALLSLEDVHGADGETLAVVEYLAENVQVHGACLVVTLRPEPGRAVELVRRLADRRKATLHELPPLGPEEVEDLIRTCLGADALPAELSDYVHARADGVPFLVEELLIGLARTGALVAGPHGWQLVPGRIRSVVPASLAGWITDRLALLDPRAQSVVSAASLLGQRFDWELVPAIAELDEASVLAALREATYAQLLVNDGAEIRFRHALTRDQVLASIIPPQRVRLARRALDVVLAAYPELPGAWCDLAAQLAELATERTLAAGHLVTSGNRARDRGALSTAASRFEQALLLLDDVGDRAPIHRLLAEVRAASGDVDGALTQADLARAVDGHDEPDAQIDIDLSLGHALLAAGRVADARRHAERAELTEGVERREQSAATRRRHLRGVLLLAEISVAEQDLATARSIAATCLEAGDLAPEQRCEALALLGRCTRVHDVRGAERLFSDVLETAETHQLVLWRVHALHELGTIDLLDRMRLDRLELARRTAIEAGAFAIAAVADLHLGAGHVARGEPIAGRVAARRSAELARRLGHAVEPWALMVVARSFAHERRAEDAEQTIRQALRLSDDPALEAQAFGHVRAMLALHLADRDRARAALDRAAERLRSVPGHHDPHRGLWALLRTLQADRDGEARREAAAAAGSDTRFNRALLAVADAVVAGREGRSGLADDRLRTGMDLLYGYEGVAFLAHLTHWLIAPAALADGWGDPIARLQDGVRWFSEHDHRPLATSCRGLLQDAGAPIPRRGRGRSVVPEVLRERGVTSREVDVLWLVGEGFTNPEIAARLVLSPRTVEKHVASLLRKTHRHGRADLAQLVTTLRVTSGDGSHER